MDKIQILDHGYLQYVEHWGSDERIIEAARMSTQKGFQGWGPHHSDNCDMKLWNDAGNCTCDPKPGDEKLLRFLWEHKHMTPFEMAGLIVEVQAPIFVFREWHRHRTQSYNEMSGRYTVLPDYTYIPSVERLMAGGQSKANKQGSEQAFTEQEAVELRAAFSEAADYAYITYQQLLKRGVAKELASRVLPVNHYSRMRASANLRNWLAFLTLRMDTSAQWEIRQYANAVADVIAKQFPRTYELFSEGQ